MFEFGKRVEGVLDHRLKLILLFGEKYRECNYSVESESYSRPRSCRVMDVYMIQLISLNSTQA